MKNREYNSRNAFDDMATEYGRTLYGRLSRKLYGRVALAAGGFKHGAILDLGCGPGYLLERLKEYGAQLSGADISPAMIESARRRLGDATDLRVADSENLPWPDDYFDVIVCTVSFHHYSHPEKSVREIKRVLKNNGHLVIGEGWLPAPFRNLANLLIKFRFLNKRGDVRVYSKAEWRAMLGSAGFTGINIKKAGSFFLIITAQISK